MAFMVAGRWALGINLNEIHYDPPGHDMGLEFVEVVNDGPTVIDVSGWSFTEGIQFTFPSGTFIAGKGFAVVCANVTAFMQAYPGIQVAGAFEGRLDSDGEAIALSNNGGGQVLRVNYSNRGKWTSVPAGTGHTLSLLRPHYDASEPESWAPSLQMGGTPGRVNFPEGGADTVEIIQLGAVWTYRKGTAEFSSPSDAWRQPSFNAAGWLTGPTGIGYGDNDDATVLDDMPNGYISVAIRRGFILPQSTIDAIDALVLAVNYDDGFVAYLNGVEVVRASMPGKPGDPVAFDTPAVSHEAGIEEGFEIPKQHLVSGANLLAIQGHNASLGSTDFSLAPRLLRRKLIAPGGVASGSILFNEFFGRTTSSRWVEIYNSSSEAFDLSGYCLSDSADALDRYVLPSGTVLKERGFLVVTEAESGLDFAVPEVRLFLSVPDRSLVQDAAIFENIPNDGRPGSRQGYSDARYPDGSSRFGFAREPTPGAPNRVEVNQDVVINEIMYQPPPENTAGEFLELFNRGFLAVDLSGWAFTRGISFTLPDGVTIPALGYLLIAENPTALEAAHTISGVLGPWSGVLSNGGESLRLVDAVGNVVDEVRYHDGGRWSAWADGGGSSLELIDPRQDNSFATAWDASDESEKSQWTQLTYTASYTAEAESEFHFLLLDSGVVRVDDVSLKRTSFPDELIPNGTFETDTSPWSLLGTHVASQRTTEDFHSGRACLEIRASGPGDNNVNKIETHAGLTMPSTTYTVSFWARWVRGCNALLTRADSSTGASLSRTHVVPIPQALGTPGRENSVRRALKLSVPGGNLGPVIDDVHQFPVTPGSTIPVEIHARAHDADGIAELAVYYRTGGVGDGVFSSAALYDDGSHRDGKADDGSFSGSIPGFPQGSRVLFYLEGRDALGAVRRYPVEAPEKTLLYSVEPPASTALFLSRLNLTDENEATLQTRFLHSDDLVDAAFVLNDEEIYYNVGVRYHGSPWNRPPDPKMYRVRFNDDRPFVRNLKSMNLSRYGYAQNEGIAYLCVQSASTPSSPSPAGEYIYTRTYHNTAYHGLMAIVETVDDDYISKWFTGDSDGYVFKIPGRRYMNNAGQMTGVQWTTFNYRGSSSNYEYERYRWYFVPSNKHSEENWSPLVDLCSIMDIARTPAPQFDAKILQILDVEQFLRVEAARTLQDDWDTIGIGNGQNAYIYYAPLEKRWKLLPWDMDHTFGNTGAKLYPEGSELQITRLVQRPVFRRIYLRILAQLLETTWDRTYMQRFLTETQATTGLDGSGILNFITTRRPNVVSIVQTADSTPLKLTSIGSYNIPADWSGEYTTTKNSERLRGSAPIRIASMAFMRNNEQIEITPSWTNLTQWVADMPLVAGENEIDILGFDDGGALAGSLAFTVLSSIWPAPALTTLDPTHGSTDGGTLVRLAGNEFHDGARVYFGAAESSHVTVVSTTEIQAVSPPGASGKVSVRVENVDRLWAEIPEAFEYIQPIALVRGDVSLSGLADISDAIQILGYLFLGDSIECLEAADVDDDSLINISDPVALLNFLFVGGPAPAPPYPRPGPDPDGLADGLSCTQGL